MARLKSHGEELARIEFSTYTLAYFVDGEILRNDGRGWKLYRKVKEGVDPREHAKRALEVAAARAKACPTWVSFCKTLLDYGRPNRWKVKATLDLLGDDVDGIWSELNDIAGIGVSVTECEQLHFLYKEGKKELTAWAASRKVE